LKSERITQEKTFIDKMLMYQSKMLETGCNKPLITKNSLYPILISIYHERQTSISKIEQYVIHLENLGKVERVGATLVDKFADVIRNSQFLNRSGKMELNLLL